MKLVFFHVWTWNPLPTGAKPIRIYIPGLPPGRGRLSLSITHWCKIDRSEVGWSWECAPRPPLWVVGLAGRRAREKEGAREKQKRRGGRKREKVRVNACQRMQREGKNETLRQIKRERGRVGGRARERERREGARQTPRERERDTEATQEEGERERKRGCVGGGGGDPTGGGGWPPTLNPGTYMYEPVVTVQIGAPDPLRPQTCHIQRLSIEILSAACRASCTKRWETEKVKHLCCILLSSLV